MVLSIGQTVIVRISTDDYSCFYGNCVKWNGQAMFIRKAVTNDLGTAYELETSEGEPAAGPTGIPYLFLEKWLIPHGGRR